MERNSALREYVKTQKDCVDGELRRLFDREPESLRSQPWFAAMEYSLFSGGKRLRPVLALAAAESLQFDSAPVLPLAAAIEMIHTYSLIHDDLPVLDNDTLRRGRPTCHTVYGVDVAIRAGMGLLAKAYCTIMDAAEAFPDLRGSIVDMGRDIFHAAGFNGMVGGQVADMLAEGKSVGLDEVMYIHRNKTAAMIRVSVQTGCNLASYDTLVRESFAEYGEKIGLAFQIVDDVLDCTSETEILGKNAGSDLERGKATYPSHVGMEKARLDARRLIDSAITDIERLSLPSTVLVDLARYLFERKM